MNRMTEPSRSGSRQCLLVAAVAVFLVNASSATAQRQSVHYLLEPYEVYSGTFDGGREGAEPAVAYSDVLVYEGAGWMQVHFGDCDLGRHSYMVLTSLEDGGRQTLNAESLEAWNYASAVFNGDQVEVQLYVDPRDEGVYINLARLRVPDLSMYDGPSEPGIAASICNETDDRVDSSEPRVGRLFFGGCTAWLVSNGAVLTAGHCTPFSGGDVLEFDVPASDSNGWTNAADPEDQYPIDFAYVAWQENGIGEDWCVFSVGRNSDTGLTAHWAQGFYRMTQVVPAVETTMRVTGYGVDNIPTGSGGGPCCDANNDDVCEYNCNSDAYTEQTSTGRFDDLEGTQLEYDVDTMPANSGSPVIWNSNGYTIGIHTAGGCDDFFSGYNNHGTHFSYDPLENAINDFPGASTVYADTVSLSAFQFGTAFYPALTVTAAVGLVPDNGIVSIVAGSYTQAAGNTFTAGNDGKAMILTAPVGTVTIGN